MRFLFVTGGGSAPVHAGVPLAWAARSAGHEVVVTAPRENVDLIVGLGLPALGVTEVSIVDAMLKDRDGNRIALPDAESWEVEDTELDFAGRGFGRLAAAQYPATAQLAEAWKPDVVVGGEYNLAAMLVARRYGLPLVRYTWAAYAQTDVDWRGATAELEPELTALGTDAIPEPDLFIDITPPSVRPGHAPPAEPMRWTPGNQQAPLAPWMYTKGDRPRVLLTSGSRSEFSPGLGIDFFRPLLELPALRETAEVVVATAEPVADAIRAEFPHLKAGYIPLEMAAPTADLAVHHGGGVSAMTFLNARVPQLILPEMQASVQQLRPIDAFGASLTLPVEHTPTDVGAAIAKMLSDSSYRQRSAELAAEIASMPAPPEIVKTIESLG